MNKINLLLLGSDPEFFLRDKNTKELISSIGIIPGTKERPARIKRLGKGYTLQIDNVLGEISVAPASSGDELWDNIQKTLNFIRERVLPDHIEIFHASSGEFTDEQLDNDIARTFGCSESINAWSRTKNNPPDAKNSNFRGCGCHIHVSYENPNPNTSYELAQAFDLFATIPSIIYDEDRYRRQFYGKAGEIRLCDYGVELRTLGGSILNRKLLFDSAIEGLYSAINFVNTGQEISDEDQFLIQMAINTQDENMAEEIIDKYSVPVLEY